MPDNNEEIIALRKEILSKINEIPDKVDFTSNNIGIPIITTPSAYQVFKTGVVNTMIAPLRRIFKDSDFQKIISIFNAMDIDLHFYNVYDLSSLQKMSLNDLTAKLAFMNENSNDINAIMSIFPEIKDDEKGYLKFRSKLMMNSSTKSPYIKVELFKMPKIDMDKYLELMSTENYRYQLTLLYLNEVIKFITHSNKYYQSVNRIVKDELFKKNKSIAQYVKDENDRDVFADDVSIKIMDFFSNYLVVDNMCGRSNYNSNISTDIYIENPSVNYISNLPDSIFPNTYGAKTNNFTILDVAHYIARSAKLEIGNVINLETGEVEEKPIGISVGGNIYSFDGATPSDAQTGDEGVWRSAVNNTISKMRGTKTLDLFVGLGLPIETEIDWVQYLLDRVIYSYQMKAKKWEATWATPNILTKHIAPLPTIRPKGYDVHVHMAIDSSGSMEDDDLRKINFIIKTLIEYAIPVIAYVHDDSSSGQIKEFKIENQDDVETFAVHRYMGGGTSHDGVFARIEENLTSYVAKRNSIVIVASDLYSDIEQCWTKYNWPKNVTTYFVTRTTGINMPFGKMINIT